MNTRLTISKMPSSSQSQDTILQDLRGALLVNRKVQEKLKQVRNTINKRMKDIEQFISTNKLNSQYPPANVIISYIKYERNLPDSYKQQIKIVQFDSEGKVKPQKQEDQFMKKLNQTKTQKKKKQLDVLTLPDNPKEIDFSRIWLQTQFSNGIMLYRAWLNSRNKSKSKSKQIFTCDEDKLIIYKYKMYGQNWQKICSLLPSRTYDEIYYQYHNRINPNLQSGRWTVRQTLMFIILLQHFAPGKWSIISQKIGVKSQLQVRERYCNLVDPSIGKEVWSFQLEKKLLEVAEEYGYCWKKISDLPIFKNKTDNSIWRKFKTLMIRFSQEEIREMLPPNKNNRGLGEKIIKEKRVFEGRRRSAKNRPQPPIYFNDFKPKTNGLQQSEKMYKKPIEEQLREGEDINNNQNIQRIDQQYDQDQSNQFLMKEDN